MKWEASKYVNVETLAFSNSEMKFFVCENQQGDFEVSVRYKSRFPIMKLHWFYTKEEAKLFVEDFIEKIKKAE